MPNDASHFNSDHRKLLEDALSKRFDMSAEDAAELATVISESFGDSDELSDENLDPHLRSVFYTLEAKKMMSFRRAEYSLDNGEKRRGFWWRLRWENLGVKATPVKISADEADVYAELPQDAWKHGAKPG